MKRLIGIRREDKNEWERRTALTPKEIKNLIDNEGFEVLVQPSPIRIFTDNEYEEAGATIQEHISECPVVFAVKEIPKNFYQQGKTYVFFSHVIKGQPYNMPMLQKMMDLKCNLIDYEKITDDKGRRLIFFGRYAGLAGMIDTFYSFGQRLNALNIPNPFERIKPTYTYGDLSHAKEGIKEIGNIISQEGLPTELSPMIVGFTGYGHVSQGAQEIVDLLPIIEITPNQIPEIYETKKDDNKHIYKVVFHEKDMVKPISKDHQFQLQDYYDHPEKYQSVMENYLPYITALINCIYWTDKYPRIITNEFLEKIFTESESPTLKIIGDISCDMEGAIECTLHETKPDNPSFIYHPFEKVCQLGVEGKGLVIMAVDNLPCELAKESSSAFGEALVKFVPAIADANFTGDIENCTLPAPIKRALILYQGELTKDYQYIKQFLS